MKLESQFLQAAYNGQFDTPAQFAPPFRDLKSDAYVQPSLENTMLEALDYPHGPQMKDVFTILVNTARAGDSQAQALLCRMAKTYAAYYEQNSFTHQEEQALGC